MEKEQEYEMSLFGKGKYVVSCENSQHPYQDIKQTGAAQGVNVYRLIAITVGLVCVIQAALNISLGFALYVKVNNKTLTQELNELLDSFGAGSACGLKSSLEEGRNWNITIHELKAKNQNLTEERDELKMKLMVLKSEHSAMTAANEELKRLNLEMKDTNNNLTQEKNDLKTQLKDLALQHTSLTEERDGLKTINSGISATNKNLTKEKEGLEKKLKDVELQHSSLKEENNELKMSNFRTEDEVKQLTEERTKLNIILNDVEAKCNILTVEKNELQRKLIDSASLHNSLTVKRDELKRTIAGLEMKSKVLMEERDTLERKLNTSVLQETSLTKAKDELKKTITVMEARSNILTAERDQMKESLKTCISQKNALITERDSLKRTNSATEEKSKSLTSENDNLTRRLNSCSSQQTSLGREKDELQTKLDVFDRYLKQNWIYFSGSFYYISTTEKSWQDSRIDCWGRGADLIIIGSKEENEFARKFQKRVWIGLSDRQIEGRWIWLDGSALRKSFWYPGEPNNDGDREDCAEMKFFNKENSWNDAPCTNKYFWICEKKTGV
ncbi:C-type lectin domain family 4 member M-like [Oryzias melastigma]|uniref:C-type lectin domain family 4 member M-like n=1 Tax=Oryzias melastigma TaxID=30732 RepID=UPI00168CFE61|nr:C-type lectin domain family 4 member M-like [Oryzias melastigma]